MNLKQLLATLDDKEVDLIVDALDHLPNKDAGANMMMDVITASMVKDPIEHQRIVREQEEKRRGAERAKEQLKQRIRILQGKILMMREDNRDSELGEEIVR
jgi:transposase